MILLNPKKYDRFYPDEKSKELMKKLIQFFEKEGKQKLKDDYHNRNWYGDFLQFVKEERIFATALTPSHLGDGEARWDTWRNCDINEILGFYGLGYWYTWQVTILGLGPIWMSKNEKIKKRAAQYLQEGEIFAFGLSERAHGADIYSTEMKLTPTGDGNYVANGEKYYIGNGNKAKMVSTFGRLSDTGDYVFFVANYAHQKYELVKNVTASQNYVANYILHEYPITEDEILSKGQDAWDSALNTVNVGKYNLGWASIGMCTHSLYEAIHHASYRRLYNMAVTDFPHVRSLFVDAYTRLVSMKLFALRTADYLRIASNEDRRYLLYNPVVKMKVTTQGEQVMNLMWDVIAAKGFEKDTFFEQAAVDIRALPKLEGTVHVNIALIVKFMPNYFLNPAHMPPVPQQNEARNDDFLFNQGPTRGLSKIRFHDYNLAYNSYDLPNIRIFKEQIEIFKEFLVKATPDDSQRKNTDFLLAIGEIFTLVVYGQLIIENSKIYQLSNNLVDQIFDFMVRDFSNFALDLAHKPITNETQIDFCHRMIKRPAHSSERFRAIWNDVDGLKDSYQMND